MMANSPSLFTRNTERQVGHLCIDVQLRPLTHFLCVATFALCRSNRPQCLHTSF